MSTPPNVDTAIGVVEVGSERHVCLRFHQPLQEIVFAPQNAFEIAEGMARAAHMARFGTLPKSSDVGYLASQIKARVTQEIRNQLVTKTAFDIRSMLEQNKDPNRIAQEVVDNLLARVA